MIFTIKGHKHFIVFRYWEEPTKCFAALKLGIEQQRVTEVVYGDMIDDKQHVLASEHAYCSHLDNFTKKRGRKEALKKLFIKLRDAEYTPAWLKTKEDRYTFWSLYLNTVGK